jgi:hypothetical protein
MNKTAIKNFAVWARNKLIADISYKAGLMGISEDGIKAALPQSTKDMEFYDIGTKEPYVINGEAVRQRKRLAELINQRAAMSDYKTAYRAVIEEVAYTWFNRLIAIRFMEVNDYLPSRIRALSSESGNKQEPDLVTTPFDAELELSDYEKSEIVRLKNENLVDECFRMLFVKQCNALNEVLPMLFENTADYSELLLNVSVTDQDGVVYHLVHDIPEDDFNISKIGEDGKPTGQVEIIGWLYQYYNTEPKDEAFALLKKNVKITKERIPAATQLFTPDWIVRYMVENSLGRLWLEGHPNPELKSEWKYYLDEAEQEADVQAKLEKIREEYKTIKPEDIKVIDPCMGSGHILVYAFDVLMQIYEAAGYTQREAAKSILENNIYGLDIDDRAFQLAYFAVMMKARQYNRRILNGETVCHVYSIQESNTVNRAQLKYFGAGLNDLERNDAMNQITGLLDTFVDAKEYGSILNVDACNWDLLRRFVAETDDAGQMSLDSIGLEDTKEQLRLLVEIGRVMAQKYDVVVTNPPYMGISNGNSKINNFVKTNYPDSKADLFSCFLEKGIMMLAPNGYSSMVTMQSWLFIASFEDLRNKALSKCYISSVMHMETMVLGIAFGTAVSIVRNRSLERYNGNFFYVHYKDLDNGAMLTTLPLESIIHKRISDFKKIPGSPIVYWISTRANELFATTKTLSEYYISGGRNKTHNDDKYLRYIWEITRKAKWCPYIKGGDNRKWFGNEIYVVDWSNSAKEEYRSHGGLVNQQFWGHEGISWSFISYNAKFRYKSADAIYSSVSPTIFSKDLAYRPSILGYLNSVVGQYMLSITSANLGTNVGEVLKTPIIDIEDSRVDDIVNSCVEITKADWDSYEISRDFMKNPLLCSDTVEAAFEKWEATSAHRFSQLQGYERELNEYFVTLYQMQGELMSEPLEKEIPIHMADLKTDVSNLISYAVGCMFGRYSLDLQGLVYDGGVWDSTNYKRFVPDTDNILPITDEEYFQDDIVGLFCDWVKKAYGADTLEENLDFIAKALSNKGNTSREVIRNYFLNDFMKDHMKIYQKRPIYWLFDSGKQNGFKALVYMHRYDENTIGNLRIDYLHRMERVYESEIARMQDIIDNSHDGREVTKATKRKEKLQKQIKECKEYDEKIAHLALARISIDLDDGVKVNYEKVQTVDGKKYPVLAKI